MATRIYERVPPGGWVARVWVGMRLRIRSPVVNPQC